MCSIFTKIIKREIPGHFVYEDDVCVVLMDKFPAVEGQTLVIPKKEIDYIFDLPKEEYLHLWEVAEKIARASDKAFEAKRTCIVVEGFEVPHAHIRLYPVPETDKSLAEIIKNPSEEPDEVLAEQATQLEAALLELQN